MTKENLLKTLKEIQWLTDRKDEKVLSSQNVRFGFEGIGHENFSCHHAKQVHGVDLVEASDVTKPEESSRPFADGIYTENSLIIGVQTADCLPILLACGHTVMALHAGWKGLTKGVIREGVRKLKTLNPKDSVFACIGPAIHPYHYEVGPELVEALQSLGLNELQVAFCLTPGKGDRWQLDLQTAGIFSLLDSGVSSSHLSVFRSCTYAHADRWHSFRRDSTRSARNWSWIQRTSL